MATQITATLPTLNFPKEVDYPTQEDWAAFSAAAELNFGILGGSWSTQMQQWKNEANAMSIELNNNSTIAQGLANYQGDWVSQGYTLGQSVSISGIYYICKLTHATGQNPTVGGSLYWSLALGNWNLKVNNYGNETISGVKTFISSPIVPTPTTNFQATTARSTNITVNVGAGQTYTTINQALEYLSGFYPLHKTNGVTATINLKAGFVMNEQVLVRGLNLGWITIVGEDAETIITHTALTTVFNGNYPAFGVDNGGTSPIIGQLFRFNVEKVGGNKHGLMTLGAGSSANINTGAGFVGAGAYGIIATIGSTIVANGANVRNAGTSGISAGQGSIICASAVNASNAGAYGVSANQCSTIDANIANFSGAGITGAIVERGSIINATVATGTLSQTKNTLTANGIIYQ